MKLTRFLFAIVGLACAIVCTPLPAVAQTPERIGFDVFLTTKTSFALGGHYNVSDLDALKLGPIKLPPGQLWAFGAAGSGGFNAGGGVMFQLKPNKQITINVGPAMTIAPHGTWTFGAALTVDITPKHNAPASTTPPIVTVISGPARRS